MAETHYFMKARTAWTFAHWFHDAEYWDDSLRNDGVPPSLSLVKEEDKVQPEAERSARVSESGITAVETFRSKDLDDNNLGEPVVHLSAKAMQDFNNEVARLSTCNDNHSYSPLNLMSLSTPSAKEEGKVQSHISNIDRFAAKAMQDFNNEVARLSTCNDNHSYSPLSLMSVSTTSAKEEGEVQSHISNIDRFAAKALQDFNKEVARLSTCNDNHSYSPLNLMSLSTTSAKEERKVQSHISNIDRFAAKALQDFNNEVARLSTCNDNQSYSPLDLLSLSTTSAKEEGKVQSHISNIDRFAAKAMQDFNNEVARLSTCNDNQSYSPLNLMSLSTTSAKEEGKVQSHISNIDRFAAKAMQDFNKEVARLSTCNDNQSYSPLNLMSLSTTSAKEEGKVQSHISNIDIFSDFAIAVDHTYQKKDLEGAKLAEVQIQQSSADMLHYNYGRAPNPSAIHNGASSSQNNRSGSSATFPKKQHVCSVCEKSFRQRSNLVVHLRAHTGDKPFQCSHCRKSFSQRGNLYQHQRIHNNEKPYTCERCGMSFRQKDHLKNHVLAHTKEKHHKCDHCGRCFSHKSNLKRHLLTHANDKPHKCEHCEKCFTSKSHLKSHTRTHTGEKPYSCPTCGKSFTHSTQQIRHSRQCTSTASINKDS